MQTPVEAGSSRAAPQGRARPLGTAPFSPGQEAALLPAAGCTDGPEGAARKLQGLCTAPCAGEIKLPATCFGERSGSETVSTCTGLSQPCLGGTITPQFMLWKVPGLLNIFEERKVPLGTLTGF